MLNKTQYTEQFGLKDRAILVPGPGQKAPWRIPAGGHVPTEWRIRLEDCREEQRKLWDEVLHQPETKRIQRVFARDLECPQKVWHLDCRADSEAEDGLLPVLLPRTEKGKSMAFHIKLPAGKKARLIFMERAGGKRPEAAELPEEQAMQHEGLPNVTIRSELGPYAELEIIYVHPLYGEEDGDAYLRPGQKKHCLYLAEAAEGASYKWTSVNFGDSLIERGAVHLNGEGASADVGGAAYIQSESEQLYQSHIHCHKPHEICRVHNHGGVENHGKGTFISVSNIDKGAHGTAAREDNRFMTLGKEAKAYADPTLLIDEYDVKASHAATVGQVDEEALFYLKSRGLNDSQAARLMTAGFLTPLFDRISIPALKERLLQQFYEKLQMDEIIGKAEDHV